MARTHGQQSDGDGGRSIGVEDGATASLSETAFVEARSIGLHAFGAATSLEVSRSVVARTLARVSDGEFGRGLVVALGAAASLSESVVVEARELGLLAAEAGTSLEVLRSVILRTLGRESDGQDGAGVWVQAGATLLLDGSAVLENRVAAVFGVSDSVLELRSSLLAGTSAGSALIYSGLADGLAASGSTVSVNGVVARDNARAGFVFDGSGGTLEGLVSSGNHYGLVFQGSPVPALVGEPVLEGNAFEGAGEAELPVPDEPLETPEAIEPTRR